MATDKRELISSLIGGHRCPVGGYNYPGTRRACRKDVAMQTPSNHSLIRLGDTNMTVLDPGLDIRGRRVIDNNGHEIGHVDDLMIDDTEKRVRFMRVADG